VPIDLAHQRIATFFVDDDQPMNVASNKLTIGSEQAQIKYEDKDNKKHYSLQSSLTSTIKEWEDPSGLPTLRTGSLWLDGLFSLAILEAQQNSQDFIQDPSYNFGQPIQARGFQTGAHWPFIWTRDIAYATDLALAKLDPERCWQSLKFKLSGFRVPQDSLPEEAKVIVQDTGSGGSWPVSSDRVVWALAARKLLPYLPPAQRADLKRLGLNALSHTLEIDRDAVFDKDDELYCGEQSFLDWREQTYPPYTAHDVTYIAASKALSTNLLHLYALETATQWAAQHEQTQRSQRYSHWAQQLRNRILEAFWLPDSSSFAAIRSPKPFPINHRQSDLLALCLLARLYPNEPRVKQAFVQHPKTSWGSPVVFPAYQHAPIYHNRAIWPFVSAYCLQTASMLNCPQLWLETLESLIQSAAIYQSHIENLPAMAAEYYTGQWPRPVVQSERQLWSVAGFLSIAFDHLFGVRMDDYPNLIIAPYLPSQMPKTWATDSNTFELTDWCLAGTTLNLRLHLPQTNKNESVLRLDYVRIAHRTIKAHHHRVELDLTKINNHAWLDLYLTPQPAPEESLVRLPQTDGPRQPVSDLDRRYVFAPNFPRISTTPAVPAQVQIFDQHQATDVYDMYRNGQRVAFRYHQPLWLDEAANPQQSNYYQIIRVDQQSELSSHPSLGVWHNAQPIFLTTAQHQIIANDNALTQDNYGRTHFVNWGSPHQILTSRINFPQTGPYLITVEYSNAYAPISTGLTATTKKLIIIDDDTNESLAQGTLIMPQRRRWRDWGWSTPLVVEFQADRKYRLEIHDLQNMSYLKHAELYTAFPGGRDGPLNRAHIASIQFISFTPSCATAGKHRIFRHS
jgi:hypothetical protein